MGKKSRLKRERRASSEIFRKMLESRENEMKKYEDEFQAKVHQLIEL